MEIKVDVKRSEGREYSEGSEDSKKVQYGEEEREVSSQQQEEDSENKRNSDAGSGK